MTTDDGPPPADSDDLPPHLAGRGEPMISMVPRPIEVSPVHLRQHDRCYGGLVVDVLADDPLSPDFTLDIVFFAPRERRKDRFVNNDSVPGRTMWANAVEHAPVEENKKMTWHYPGRGCLPEVVLRGAGA